MVSLAGAVRRPIGVVPGIWGWITTVDHKRIGVLYLVTALGFFLFGGIEALIMRVQLARPENSLVSPSVYNELFTMHGTTMIFLAAMPLSAAFFNFAVPLLIGARDVAFPRLNAFSYWVFLFGGLLLNWSFLVGAVPNAGWFAYANLTTPAFSPGNGMNFWILGLQVLGISTLASAFNFLVTIINMRAPGMSLMRMPVFVWTTLATAVLIVLAFPIITVAVTMLMMDRLFGLKFFETTAGADPLLWQHLFWLFGHPEVYILILPAMGIVSEVIPVFSRKPLFGYPFVVMATAGIAFLGFGVWVHHMFTTGLSVWADAAFGTSTMLIAIPTGVKIFNWLGTMWGGSISFKTPMLFAVGFIAMFIIGGLSGVMHASPPVDSQQQDSYFVVAHLHYVLFGGTIMGIFAGIYYWFPKMTGRILSEGLGKLNFWLMVIGMNLTFFPMHFLGIFGMPRRIYTYPGGMGWDIPNMIATVGAFTLGAAVIVFVVNVVKTLKWGEKAGADPWDGATLEWTIPSPPPAYNYEEIPHVRSRDAAWAMKYGAGRTAHDPHPMTTAEPARNPLQETAQPVRHAGDGAEHGPRHAIHMPDPSYWPIVLALGLALMAAGLIYTYVITGVGAVLAVVSIYGWAMEPPSAVHQPSAPHDVKAAH